MTAKITPPIKLDNLKKDIGKILDQQEFEVNEPSLNRKEIIEQLIQLFEQQI